MALGRASLGAQETQVRDREIVPAVNRGESMRAYHGSSVESQRESSGGSLIECVLNLLIRGGAYQREILKIFSCGGLAGLAQEGLEGTGGSKEGENEAKSTVCKTGAQKKPRQTGTPKQAPPGSGTHYKPPWGDGVTGNRPIKAAVVKGVQAYGVCLTWYTRCGTFQTWRESRRARA